MRIPCVEHIVNMYIFIYSNRDSLVRN